MILSLPILTVRRYFCHEVFHTAGRAKAFALVRPGVTPPLVVREIRW